MKTTRRTFLEAVAAWSAWPSVSFAAGRDASPWETPDGMATDSVMVRRLHLDLAGRIPTKDEAVRYVRSGDPRKREALAEKLMASGDFANFWAMRFCDILRVKSEFPINLWPNAVYVYHARIRRFVADGEPWDAFARALLTAQGSDFRDAESNFFRATDNRTPAGWAEAAAQTFLGIPPAELDPRFKAEIAQYFENVRIKNSREWKEEIVYTDGPDVRGELCDILFGKRRAETARAFRRLVRSWIFGPGDSDADAPAGEGSMLLRDVVREAVLSDAYARGSVTGGFPARKIEAEVLDDALCTLGGGSHNYQSPAPEPFTFLPPDRPTVCIEDGSISNGFLSLFGRPARDTGLPGERGTDVTAKQRLYLFNSQSVHVRLGGAAAAAKAQGGFSARTQALYWSMLSRAPAESERLAAAELWKRRGGGRRKDVQPHETLRDVAWCILNSKEFLFRI